MIEPPYKNRWGAEPGPNYRQCRGITLAGKQCRRGASRGVDFCDTHHKQQQREPYICPHCGANLQQRQCLCGS